jgi:hypothetical protein
MPDEKLNIASKYLISFKNRIPVQDQLRKASGNEGKISIKAYKKSFANIINLNTESGTGTKNSKESLHEKPSSLKMTMNSSKFRFQLKMPQSNI